MRFNALVLALVVASVAAAAALGGAAPITANPLATGAMAASTIHAKSGQMILESITVAPGGSFGWHVHGAPVAVVITGGTLTVFDPDVAACQPFKVSKGQSFVEPPNHVHLARNDSGKPVTLYAMYLGLPKGVAAMKAVSEPAGCNA